MAHFQRGFDPACDPKTGGIPLGMKADTYEDIALSVPVQGKETRFVHRLRALATT
jgi:hypothetical protein